MAAEPTNPSFDLPQDDPDTEVWVLRAPAALDVQALLNGVTLDVDPKSLQDTSTNNNVLSTFKDSDDTEFVLTLGDANESDNLRLLVPDNKSNSDDDKEFLVPYNRPFHRQINLTSVLTCQVGATSSSSNVQEDLILAPPKDAAPKPAFDQSGNGSVDTMRLAYVPVPQRQGLKRRWAMPGSKIREAAPSALYSTTTSKRARLDDDGGNEDVHSVAVSDEDEQTSEKVSKSTSSKKEKKEKKKKEKKSKKTPKK